MIITISGKSRSGKDTTAAYLKEKFSSYDIDTVALADKLKIVCCYMLNNIGYNITLDHFYDEIEKERERTLINGSIFTLRKLMQDTGTEFKSIFGQDFWCRELYKTMDPSGYYIISDCRYQYEIDYFNSKFSKVISLKLERDQDNNLSEKAKQHSSETEMDDIQYDYIIDNNSSKEELYSKLDEIFDSELTSF